MKAFRSTCIRVVDMSKHCNTAAASIVHMYTDKRLRVFLVVRHLSCQYIWMTLRQGVCTLPEYQHLPAKQAAALFSDICALSFMENHNIYHIILSHELRTLLSHCQKFDRIYAVAKSLVAHDCNSLIDCLKCAGPVFQVCPCMPMCMLCLPGNVATIAKGAGETEGQNLFKKTVEITFKL
jgi:hypothetical protein